MGEKKRQSAKIWKEETEEKKEATLAEEKE